MSIDDLQKEKHVISHLRPLFERSLQEPLSKKIELVLQDTSC